MTDPFARPTVADTAILVRDVNYSFGEGDARTRVLFDVDLEIGRGEIVILTGPSGAGKSTLLTLVGALRTAQDGAVHVLGRDLSQLNAQGQSELRKNIGFIFQGHHLFNSLTAFENVRMAAALRPERVDALNRRCGEVLIQLGLEDRMHYFPPKLSGGQRQRVAIARALVNRPALVLADEPTASLDVDTAQQVMNLLRALTVAPERTTIVLITHDQRVIDQADRVVNLVSGRICSNARTVRREVSARGKP